MLLYAFGLSRGQSVHRLHDVSSNVPTPVHLPKMYSPSAHCERQLLHSTVSEVVFPVHKFVLNLPAPQDSVQGTHSTAS